MGDVHAAQLLESLLSPTATGEPHRFVDFAAPIRIGPTTVGVFAIHGSWQWTREVLESLAPASSDESALELFIFDRQGTLIFAPGGRTEVMRAAGQRLPEGIQINNNRGGGNTQTTVARWQDGKRYLTAATQLQPRNAASDLGWRIVARQPVELAFAEADDTVQLFRPDCNAKRFQDSADRLCIPKIPVEDYIQAVETLVDVDRDWVPHSDGASLYIRPFVFANDVGLGVHASKHYIFCIICAPSGAYYAEGINPVRIYVEDEYIRAAPGLTGFTKCGGNYAASIKAGELAEEQGYAQVLWLDGVEKKYVEEVGSMNIMFKIDGKVYTAATVGTVLPGVTRRSCIELLKDWGYEVVEGKIAIADIMAAAREGKLEEVFGTGTAAVVSPVKELVWKGEHAYIGDGKIGPVTQKLYDTMTGMQWGKIPDTKGWIVPVEKKY